MAMTYKILAQSAPLATTSTKIYTVPAATSTVISTIVVCNRAATADTFRISVDVADANTGTATKCYLTYGTAIQANDSITLTLGITLATTDTVYIYAGTANLSVNVFGSEIT